MQYFSVKNYEQFQHYRDRTPPWIKFYNTVLDDYEIGQLPDASKAHLFAIWLLASRYSNRVPYDSKWLSRRINATEKVDLNLLQKCGFIKLEQECSESLAECYQDARPEREGEGETEREKERETLYTPNAVKENFEAWWQAYPRKVARKEAARVYAAVLKRKEAEPAELLAGLHASVAAWRAEGRETKLIPYPATWLNQGRWQDDNTTVKRRSLLERFTNGNDGAGSTDGAGEVIELGPSDVRRISGTGTV